MVVIAPLYPNGDEFNIFFLGLLGVFYRKGGDHDVSSGLALRRGNERNDEGCDDERDKIERGPQKEWEEIWISISQICPHS